MQKVTICTILEFHLNSREFPYLQAKKKSREKTHQQNNPNKQIKIGFTAKNQLLFSISSLQFREYAVKHPLHVSANWQTQAFWIYVIWVPSNLYLHSSAQPDLGYKSGLYIFATCTLPERVTSDMCKCASNRGGSLIWQCPGTETHI